MKCVIWGAGEYGRRFLFHIGEENVVAFIDSDSSQIGKQLCGKEIISYDDYKVRYCNICIVISTHEYEIVNTLRKDNINKYFLLSDCPDEFRSANPRNDLKDYVFCRVEKGKTYAVYGKSLFSIMVYEWVKQKSLIDPYFILKRGMNCEIVKDIKKMYGNQVIEIEELKNHSVDNIYNTDKAIEQGILDRCSEKMENILAGFHATDIYYNPAIERFKNIYENRRCFIIATGPSLTIQDLETLNNEKEICISMNNIWHAFDDTAWRPQFYVADDYRVMRDSPQALDYMKEGYSFIGDEYKPFCEKEQQENVLLHHVAVALSEDELPLFSEDYSRICYGGGTVTYSCIQLAVYMGFKEIYLLGVDFSYAGESEKKYSHFYKERELTSISRTECVRLAYMSAKKYSDSHGIKIYNATRGGKLDIFERVNFDGLF